MQGNVVLLVDTNQNTVHRLYLASALDAAKDTIKRRFSSSETETYKMCGEFAQDNWVAFYQQGGWVKAQVSETNDLTKWCVLSPVLAYKHTSNL